MSTYAAMILTAWVAYILQSWGDQGLYDGTPMVLVGVLAGLGISLSLWHAAPPAPDAAPLVAR